MTSTMLSAGRVQGVGFRAAIKRIASGYEVTGWVKELADGRVEMPHCAHDDDELQGFLDEVEDSDLAAFIKEREQHIIPPLTGVRGFSIVR